MSSEALGFITPSTTYNPIFRYNATGGYGMFNNSDFAVDLPEVNVMFANQLFTNLFMDVRKSTPSEPIVCSKYDDCVSYLFPGFVGLIVPTPYIVNNFSTADVIQVDGLASIQIDFWAISPSDTFLSNDCRIWGTKVLAIQVCISAKQDHFIAGTTYKKEILHPEISACPESSPDCLRNLT